MGKRQVYTISMCLLQTCLRYRLIRDWLLTIFSVFSWEAAVIRRLQSTERYIKRDFSGLPIGRNDNIMKDFILKYINFIQDSLIKQ